MVGVVSLTTNAMGMVSKDSLDDLFNEVTYKSIFYLGSELQLDMVGSSAARPTRCTAGAGSTTIADFSAVGGVHRIGGIKFAAASADANFQDFGATFHMPRDWNEGTTVRPTVHFSRIAAYDTAPGNATVGFLCAYKWVHKGTSVGTATVITSHSCGGGALHSAMTEANIYQSARFPAITPPATAVIGSSLRCYFRRDLGSNGTSWGGINIHGLGLIYKADERMLGSSQEMSSSIGASPK
jgi:hypothetical protein